MFLCVGCERELLKSEIVSSKRCEVLADSLKRQTICQDGAAVTKW